MNLNVGNLVKSKKYGYVGIITTIYSNWNDLKLKNHFHTIDPDDESNKMDSVEKLINGDPKDAWLDCQEIPFTVNQLHENWYSVKCLDGGSIWTCNSTLEILTNSN